MMDDAQQRLEDLRREIVAALYARRTGAHEAPTIRSVFLRTAYKLDEVEAALADLVRFGFVERLFESEVSSVPLFQLSAKGIVYKERGFRA